MPIQTVFRVSEIKNAIVVISIPCELNWEILDVLKIHCTQRIMTEEHKPQLLKHTDNTVLAYCLFKIVEHKFGGSMNMEVRRKFADCKCNYSDGQFNLVLRTAPNGSAIKGILTDVAKCLSIVVKLGQLYKRYSNEIGFKCTVAHFESACHSITNGLKSSKVFITGKLKVTDELVSIFDTVFKTKLTISDAKMKHLAEDAKLPVRTIEPLIKSKDMFSCLLAAQYLQYCKIETIILDNGLIPVIGAQNWSTIEHKVKDNEKIKRYVQSTMTKLGDKLPLSILARFSQYGLLSADELGKLPTSYTEASLITLIKKSL